MSIYWRPHHEVYPELAPEPDFVAFDEATDALVGRVHLITHGGEEGRWHWSLHAHSPTGRVPFHTHGYSDSRGEAGRGVAEAYRQLVQHNARNPRRQ